MVIDLDFIRRQNQQAEDKDANGIFSQGKDLLIGLLEAVDQRMGGALGALGLIAADVGKSELHSYSVGPGSGSVPYDENYQANISRPAQDFSPSTSLSPEVAPPAPELSPKELFSAAVAMMPQQVMDRVQESMSQMRSWVPQGGADAVLAQAQRGDLGTMTRVAPFEDERLEVSKGAAVNI